MRTRDLPTCLSFFVFLVGILPFVVGTYLVCVAWSGVLYCRCIPGIILPSRATTAISTPYIKTNISSSWVYQKQHHQQHSCNNKHTNREDNLHGRVVKKRRKTLKLKHKTAVCVAHINENINLDIQKNKNINLDIKKNEKINLEIK